MATNFPTSVDNFTNPTANDSLNLPSHSTQHANANDAIEAIEDVLVPAVNAWTPFTPTLLGMTLGNGVLDFAYSIIGKTVHVRGRIDFGSTTASTSASKGFVLPFTRNASYAGIYPTLGAGMYYAAGALFPCSNLQLSTANSIWVAHTAGGTYVNTIDIGPSVPATFANAANELHVALTYERD